MKNVTVSSIVVACFFLSLFLTQWTKSYLLLNLNDLYVLHQNISNVQAVVEKNNNFLTEQFLGLGIKCWVTRYGCVTNAMQPWTM